LARRVVTDMRLFPSGEGATRWETPEGPAALLRWSSDRRKGQANPSVGKARGSAVRDIILRAGGRVGREVPAGGVRASEGRNPREASAGASGNTGACRHGSLAGAKLRGRGGTSPGQRLRLKARVRSSNGGEAATPRGVRLVRGERPRRENLGSAPGMKQGRVGWGGWKPSGGWETLEAERSGGRGKSPQQVNPSGSVALRRTKPQESCQGNLAVRVRSSSEGGPSSREDVGRRKPIRNGPRRESPKVAERRRGCL
jgi:hypothetical protein